MLTALRSHCLRGIKVNFKKMYKQNVNCPLNCDTEIIHEDTQSHILSCKSLQKPKDQIVVKMDQMNGTVKEQNQLVKQFSVLYQRRLKKIEEQEERSCDSLPGASFLDLSTPSLQQQQQGAAAVPSVQLLG